MQFDEVRMNASEERGAFTRPGCRSIRVSVTSLMGFVASNKGTGGLSGVQCNNNFISNVQFEQQCDIGMFLLAFNIQRSNSESIHTTDADTI